MNRINDDFLRAIGEASSRDEVNREVLKQNIVASLFPTQLRYLDAVRWMSGGLRGAGKTYLLCVGGLLDFLDYGEGYVVDHHPHSHPDNYIRHQIFELAERFGILVAVRKIRDGVYKISRIEEKKK